MIHKVLIIERERAEVTQQKNVKNKQHSGKERMKEGRQEAKSNRVKVESPNQDVMTVFICHICFYAVFVIRLWTFFQELKVG